MNVTHQAALLLGLAAISLGGCAYDPLYDEPAPIAPAAYEYQYEPSVPAAPPAQPSSERVLAAAGTVRDATDPSSAIDAYARARGVFGDNVALLDSYVTRMVEFGLPEMAETQAAELVRRDPSNGLAWAVNSYMSAKRGQMPAAVSQLAAATRRAPDSPFVARTAGQLLAWHDTLADQSSIDDQAKQMIATIRQDMGKEKLFTEAYNRAADFYSQNPPPAPATQPAAATQPGHAEAIAPPSPEPAVAPSPPPYEVVERSYSSTYVPPPVYTEYGYSDYYPDPFFYPTYGYARPWWPGVYYPSWSWWPTFGSVVFVGGSYRHHHDHDWRDHREWRDRDWRERDWRDRGRDRDWRDWRDRPSPTPDRGPSQVTPRPPVPRFGDRDTDVTRGGPVRATPTPRPDFKSTPPARPQFRSTETPRVEIKSAPRSEIRSAPTPRPEIRPAPRSEIRSDPAPRPQIRSAPSPRPEFKSTPPGRPQFQSSGGGGGGGGKGSSRGR